MDPLTITAAAGMRARLESLDLLSNNLANANTPGYKADRESYSTYLSPESAEAAAQGAGLGQAISPLIESNWIDMRQGTIRPTGDDNHLALDGAGFMVAGAQDRAVLLRSVELRVAEDGRLLANGNLEMLTAGGRPLSATPGLPITVTDDGTVLQNGATVGQLQIVSAPSSPAGLRKEGGGLSLDKSSLPGLQRGAGAVRQGYQEDSNVNPTESSMRLIQILRQFEGLQRAMQIGGEMSRKTIEEVARVTP